MEVLLADLTWTGDRFEEGIKVVVDAGEIVAVGDSVTHAVTRRLERTALMPGFVNCHSHAFQRGLRGRGETYPRGAGVSSFWTWRQEMYALVEKLDLDQMYELTRRCFEEMRDAGITSCGEFHYLHHNEKGDHAFDDVVLRAARDAGIRIVLLSAFYARAGFEGEALAPAQRRFDTPSIEGYWAQLARLSQQLGPLQTLGVVAHSLRAVSLTELAQLHEGAVIRRMPFHLHIEEQPREVEQCLAAHHKTPMELLLETIRVDELTTAVHCNHTKPDELRRFAAAGGNVCVCPLTEGSLGDGIMPDLGSARGRVCLGTDCNARICFFEEMRWLEYSQRLAQLRRGVCVERADSALDAVEQAECAGVQLLDFATRVGARSLGLPVGAIKAGLRADFVAVDLASHVLDGVDSESLASALSFGASGAQVVSATCIEGKWRPTRGRQPPEVRNGKRQRTSK